MVFYELQYGESSSNRQSPREVMSQGRPWIWFYNTKAEADRDAKMLSKIGIYENKFTYRIFKREWTTRTIVEYMNNPGKMVQRRKLANPKTMARG